MLYDIIVTTLFIGWGAVALAASVFWFVMSLRQNAEPKRLMRK